MSELNCECCGVSCREVRIFRTLDTKRILCINCMTPEQHKACQSAYDERWMQRRHDEWEAIKASAGNKLN